MSSSDWTVGLHKFGTEGDLQLSVHSYLGDLPAKIVRQQTLTGITQCHSPLHHRNKWAGMWATGNKSTAPSSSSMGDWGCKSLASADRSYFPFHSLGMLLAQQNSTLRSPAHLLLVLPFELQHCCCTALQHCMHQSGALLKKIVQNEWCHGFCAWAPLVVTFVLHQG